MDIIYATAHKWMATPFVWGASDCMLVLADYLVALGYIDIGDKWRGTYDSALSCQRASGFLTDPVKPLRDGVARIPLDETMEPERGDIGVIRMRDGNGKMHGVGALFLGKNWAVKGENQVMVGPASEILAAWSVPCAR